MADISKIPLNEIMKDLRVQEQVNKQAREWAKMNIAKFRNNQSQIGSCHAWLLLLHYEAINRLNEKYNITKPEFMVLMAAYLFHQKGLEVFKTAELSSTLLRWQHTRIYRHLKKLAAKGYIETRKSQYWKSYRHTLTIDGKRVIRAFSQHYWQVFDEVWGKMGDLPGTFSKGYF